MEHNFHMNMVQPDEALPLRAAWISEPEMESAAAEQPDIDLYRSFIHRNYLFEPDGDFEARDARSTSVMPAKLKA